MVLVQEERVFTLQCGAQIRVLRNRGPSKAKHRTLLLHGNPGSLSDWEQLGSRLSAHTEWAALDLPGFGRSSRLGSSVQAMSLDSLADAVIEVANRLGWQAPFHLLGHSHGGGVAAVVAAKHPQRIRRLVLVATLGAVPHQSYKLLSIPGMRGLVRVAGALFRFPKWNFFTRTLLVHAMKDVFLPAIPSEDRIRTEFENLRHRPQILVSMVDVTHGSPCKKLCASAASIKSPVLFIHGEKDNVVPQRSAIGLHELIVGAGGSSQVRLLKGAGHMIIEYQADETASLVLDFLEADSTKLEPTIARSERRW